MKTTFFVNSREVMLDVTPDDLLLWVLREKLNLTGTKFGCGIGQCGACTVLLNGKPVKACLTPISSIEGQSINTVEGLSVDFSHPLQKAWIEEQVPQCGYCQSGQLMQACALIENNSNPSREEIVDFMSPILCRCGTYLRVVKAIEKVCKKRNRND